ncbi:movement protein [Sesamum angolense]|uniref:Movement protein n=1 Tax=Sesamum angolense TaxID=2727404 RepID=A0AAE2BN90_9LAMI|nr:movement protein [Sesamum angolense]
MWSKRTYRSRLPAEACEIRKFEATDDILDAVYYGELVPIYQFEDLPSDESVYEEEIEMIRMDLQPSQNNHSDEDRLQTSESLSGFFSRMTVSNKTMERIMRQDSNLSPYDGFRIGGIGKVLNQIGLNQRKHHIIYKVSSGEFAIPMEFTGNVMEMQLIPKEEILEELSRLREEIAITMKWIHIGTIEVVIKATFKEGIDSEIHLSIMDRRINNLRYGCLGTMKGNLYAGKLMFDIHPRIAYNLADQDFSRVLTLHQDFKRKDLMKEGNRPYSITYRIAYAISNTHHSDLFIRKEYIEILRIFKEFAKVMAPDPIRIPRIGGVDIIIKHPVLDRTMSSRIEYGSRMSFSEDRITGYKGKEKDLARVLTPREIRVDNVKLKCPEGWKEIQVIFDITKNENFFPCDDLYHLQQPVVGRYEGMLEIAGHEFLVTGVAGRENGCMTLGLIFLEDHKPWGRKGNEYLAAYIDSGSGICIAKPGVFPKEARETLPVIAGRDFSQKILILNTGIREAKIMIGEHLERPGSGQQGLIDSDSFYEESEEEIKNLREALMELKTMDISEESMLSLENVKRLIQRNFSENPLAWWDRNKIEATLKIKEECKYEYIRYKPIQMNMEDKKDMQIIIKEHINLGLIEPGISAYSSPGFLIKMENESKKFTAFSTPQGILIDEAGIELQEHIVEKIRNFPDVLKDKKQLQSFLGVVNFAGIFIKDLAKYRKDFRPLLKETESAKWKWEEIHTQRVREQKQVCNNLSKLAKPQDEDELVVYTYANDYRWAAVLMKKTTTGEEPCRYTGGLFTEQQAQVWHINEKEFFAMEGTEANSVMLRLRHLIENLEELDREFGRLAVNAQVAGQVQRADLDKVQTNIRSSLVASTALWNALQEPIRKASPSVMTRELRDQGSKPALRVQNSKPVAADSSTACTRPSSDSGETATNESQGVKTSDDSSQPSTSGVKEGEISLRPMTSTSKTNTNELSSSSSSAWQVYQRMWEKLISRKGVNPSKTIIETSGKYNRVWMMEGSKLEEVREWYEFGALASVYTMSPSFSKISKLPEWISGAVYDSWQNNPHLKRGDILELKFISAAPEMAGKGSHPAFHFIKLQRPDMVAFNRIKATTDAAPLVSAISEDDIPPEELGVYGSVSLRWTKSSIHSRSSQTR